MKFLLIPLTVILSACTIHPPYQKPAVTTPSQWYAPMPKQQSLASLEDWWKQFNDPALSQLILFAQNNNPDIEIALANIQAARANARMLTGQLYPTLDGTIAKRKALSGNAGGSGSIETESASLDASWEINLFGTITFARKSAKASVDSQILNWHQGRISLAAEVATNYVQYRACEESVDMLEEAKRSQDETARLTKVAADAGFRAPADAALANANASTSASNLVAQQTTCALLVKSITLLTQLPESEVKNLLTTQQGIPVVSGFKIATLPANLIKQRPDIMAKERALASSSAEIGISKAALYPSITLNGSIGYQRTVFNTVSFNTRTWSFGPSINIPLFDGGQRRAQVDLNVANFNVAYAEFKQTIQSAIDEVEQNLAQLDAANRRASLEAKSVEELKRFFEASEINWKSGGLDLLSLEDARRQYITAQNSLITQERDRVLFWIALFKAFGGDWTANLSEDEKRNIYNES